MDKNKSISLHWDLNFFFCQLKRNFVYSPLTNMAALPHGCKPGLRLYPERFQVVGYMKLGDRGIEW